MSFHEYMKDAAAKAGVNYEDSSLDEMTKFKAAELGSRIVLTRVLLKVRNAIVLNAIVLAIIAVLISER